jgi:hypothetical protein
MSKRFGSLAAAKPLELAEARQPKLHCTATFDPFPILERSSAIVEISFPLGSSSGYQLHDRGLQDITCDSQLQYVHLIEYWFKVASYDDTPGTSKLGLRPWVPLQFANLSYVGAGAKPLLQVT